MSDNETAEARLIVTGVGGEDVAGLKLALERALPDAAVRETEFYAVFDIEGEGDAEELARTAIRECGNDVGHVVAVYAEVESRLEEIREAAVRVALERVRPGESFSFRLHKRGSHFLKQDTPEIEPEIGEAVGEALLEAHEEEPVVDLEYPDVTVQAELLGPLTAIGISRSGWYEGRVED